jgi:hypothetical protein
MPTMAKKIQSNECSLTAAVWANLEATHGCHHPVTLTRMSMAPPDLLNDRNHPGEFYVKQCSSQPSFGDRGNPPHSHGLRDVRVSLGRR